MAHDLIKFNYKISTKLLNVVNVFLEAFDFNHFNYIKLIDEDKKLYVSTNLKWIESYLKYELYNDIKHEKLVYRPNIKNKIEFWNEHEMDKVFKVANQMDMWHGVIIRDSNEIYSFSTYKWNKGNINKYLANLDLFDHFILYFRDVAGEYLNPDPNLLLTTKKINYSFFSECINDDIRNLMPIKNYFVKDNCGKEYKITKREAETLHLLASGMTFAESARKLGISTRTLEKYVENLKETFKCFGKSKLLKFYYESNLNCIKL